MKPQLLFLCATLALGSTPIAAQEKEVKEEIIIEKKKGGKAEKTTIVIDGDRVTINGKDARNYKGKIDLDGRVVIAGDEVRISGGGKDKSMNVSTTRKRVRLGVTSESISDGSRITEVIDNSPAKAAGLQEGDVITHINGKSVKGADALGTTVREHKAGEEVKVDYLRDGKKKSTKAVLDEVEQGFTFAIDNDDFRRNMEGFNRDMESFGRGMEELERNQERYNRNMEEFRLEIPRFRWDDNRAFVMEGRRPRFGMNVQDNEDGEGVLVNEVEPGTAAAKGGLMQGDIITAVDGKPIKDLETLRQLLRSTEEGKSMKMSIKRGNTTQELDLRTPKRIEKGAL